MSSNTKRPYAGTWLPNRRGIVRYSPDCILYLNGDTSLPSYAADHRVIDIQPFITDVSADAGTDAGGSSASVSLAIPRQVGSALFRDGYTAIQTGLEVHIYMRGFFPMKGATKTNGPDDLNELTDKLGESAADLPVRPYYPVFHGVITSVSHSVSGGIYQCGFECSGMLHFWQTQTVSVNGALLGERPIGGKTKLHFARGHAFSNMTPFSVIYSLYRDVAGAANGIGYALSSGTNVNSLHIQGGEKTSLWQSAMMYWERRFATKVYGLKMYGADGSLFNTTQQAILGKMTDGDLKRQAKSDFRSHTTSRYTAKDPLRFDPGLDYLAKDPKLGKAIKGSVTEDQMNLLGRASPKDGISVSIPSLKAFATDYSIFGSVNLFEGTYESKLDLAQQVADACGYEFYQDVDGDLVFKPPMYNMDTRSSPAYNIRPIDIINLSFTENEPDVTYMTCKSGAFQNQNGTGLDNQWGVRGMYVDYRLVSKYGWKPGDFESSFYSSGSAAFYAAVAKLDHENRKRHSASVTIPMRPELRPGYPVYIQHIDAFYYIESMAHSFSFGGQCTTTLQLTARRIKFVPPGMVLDGRTGIDAVTLDKPWNPPCPLIAMDASGQSLKQIGFPNVVMAYDIERSNAAQMANEEYYTEAIGLDLVSKVDKKKGTVHSHYANNAYHSTANLLQTARKLGLISFPSVESEVQAGSKDPYDWSADAQIAIGKENGEIIWGRFNFMQLKEQEALIRSKKQQYENKRTLNILARKKDKSIPAMDVWNNEMIESNQFYQTSVSRGDASDITYLQLQEILKNNVPSSTNMMSSAQLLDIVSNKKATFSNAETRGYYRYYSSSHPDETMQACGSLMNNFTDAGGIVSSQTSAYQDPLQGDRVMFKTSNQHTNFNNLPYVNPEDWNENILRRTYVEFSELDDMPSPRVFNILKDTVKKKKDRKDKKYSEAENPEQESKKLASHNIFKLEFQQFIWRIPLLVPLEDSYAPRMMKGNKEDFIAYGVKGFMYGKWRFTDPEATLRENLKPFFDSMDMKVPQILNVGGHAFDEPYGGKPSLLEEIFSRTSAVVNRDVVEGMSNSSTWVLEVGKYPRGSSILDVPLVYLPAYSWWYSFAYSGFQGKAPASTDFQPTSVLLEKLWETIASVCCFVAWQRLVDLNGAQAAQFKAKYPQVKSDPNKDIVGTDSDAAKADWTGIFQWCTGFTELFGCNIMMGGVYKHLSAKRMKKMEPLFAQISPVFPVSDGGGYEHFGSYGYGRGMDIRPGGNFEELMTQDPLAHMDEEIDEFVDRLFKKDKFNVSNQRHRDKFFGVRQSRKVKAQMKAEREKYGLPGDAGRHDPNRKAKNTQTMQEYNSKVKGTGEQFSLMVDGILSMESDDPMAWKSALITLKLDPAKLEGSDERVKKGAVTLGLINRMTTSEKTVSVTNAAYSLADLSPADGLPPYGFIHGGSVVGDTFIDLEAFDPNNFVYVAPEGESLMGEKSAPISTWVKDQMSIEAVTWSATQRRLRGEEEVDTPRKSIDEIKDDLLK